MLRRQAEAEIRLLVVGLRSGRSGMKLTKADLAEGEGEGACRRVIHRGPRGLSLRQHASERMALARPHLVARLRRLVSHGRALTRAVAEAGTRLEQRKTELMRKLHGN